MIVGKCNTTYKSGINVEYGGRRDGLPDVRNIAEVITISDYKRTLTKDSLEYFCQNNYILEEMQEWEVF